MVMSENDSVGSVAREDRKTLFGIFAVLLPCESIERKGGRSSGIRCDGDLFLFFSGCGPVETGGPPEAWSSGYITSSCHLLGAIGQFCDKITCLFEKMEKRIPASSKEI